MDEPRSPTELHKAGDVRYWAIWPHPRGVGFVVAPGLKTEDPPGSALSALPDWLNLYDAKNRFISLEEAAAWCRKHGVDDGVHVTEDAWDASI